MWPQEEAAVEAGGGGGEGAAAFQPELVQMEGPGEQAAGQVGVGQNQVCCIHPAHRSHPHSGRARQETFPHRRTGFGDERGRMGGDGDGEVQHRVAEVHARVPQAQGRRGLPAGPLAVQLPGSCLQRHGNLENRSGQVERARAHHGAEARQFGESGSGEERVTGELVVRERGAAGEPRRVEVGVAGELRVVERGVAGELCVVEVRGPGESRPTETGDAGELRGREMGSAGELCVVE